MIPKLGLTVDAWIKMNGREAAFGTHDSRARCWTPVIPLPSWSGLVCKRCGLGVHYGWRLGLKGKTAYCRDCVVLTDSHKGRDECAK